MTTIDETVRQHKFILDESEMPTAWYNIVPDLPSPPPPALHPGTLQPAGPDDFAPLFPMDLILQEVSQDRYIDIPGAVLDVYRQWRPSPCSGPTGSSGPSAPRPGSTTSTRAVSPAGSHKPNTAVPQAYYNAKAGVQAAHHRDRGRASGAPPWPSPAPSTGWSARSGRWGVLRPEALPALMMGPSAARSTVRPARSPRPAGPCSSRTRQPRLPGHRHLRGRRGGGPGPRDPLRPGQRAQPRADAPDHHRRGGAAAAGQGRRDGSGPLVGCTGGGSNFGGLAFPFMREKLAGRDEPGRSGPWSRRRAPR